MQACQNEGPGRENRFPAIRFSSRMAFPSSCYCRCYEHKIVFIRKRDLLRNHGVSPFQAAHFSVQYSITETTMDMAMPQREKGLRPDAMLQLDKSISKPFYVQIEYYRQEIESSRMVAGMRLDSVRNWPKRRHQQDDRREAYYQLASEGYIPAPSQARYEVASLGRREQVPEEDRQTRCRKSSISRCMTMILPAATWP